MEYAPFRQHSIGWESVAVKVQSQLPWSDIRDAFEERQDFVDSAKPPRGDRVDSHAESTDEDPHFR